MPTKRFSWRKEIGRREARHDEAGESEKIEPGGEARVVRKSDAIHVSNRRPGKMYSVHEIVAHSEGIKVAGRSETAANRFLLSYPKDPTTRKKKKEMRASHALIVISALCTIVECGGTRVARTLPFDLSPSRWFSTLRAMWTGGGFWRLPRNGAESLLRLIASPDTKKKMVFEFKPEDGPRASYDYQRRYGYRGEWLIELLGSGFHPNGVPHRRRSSAVPPSVLVPPPYYSI